MSGAAAPLLFRGQKRSLPLTLAGDFYGYMNYDREVIDIAAQAIGVTREMIEVQKRELRCGVPYVIPVSEAGRRAELWLEAIDAFPPRRWEDSMHAFGLAVAKMKLRVTLTQFADHNYWPDNRVEREMIHYCYGDEVWSKRDYLTDADARRVWNPPSTAREGTISWERDPDFGYEVATAIPGLEDEELMQPRRLYARQGRQDEYSALVARFKAERQDFLGQFPKLDRAILEAI